MLKLALPFFLVIFFSAAVLVACGEGDGAIAFGKTLMSSSIFAFVFFSFWEKEDPSISAGGTQINESPATKYLVGIFFALSVGVTAIVTLSDVWVHGRKLVILLSVATILASSGVGHFLMKRNSANGNNDRSDDAV